MDSTYSQAMAAAAAAAGPQPITGALCLFSPTQGTCMGTMACPSGSSTPNAYYLDNTDDLTNPYCYVWEFASGGTSGTHTYASGHVYATSALGTATKCGCPYSTDPTWN
jgi:hypothetical protein